MASRIRKGQTRAIAAALAIVTALTAVPAQAGRRTGASVMITTILCERVEGELIAVRPSSLLIMDRSGRDLALDLADVRSVRVTRKSRAGAGGLFGLAVGAAGGYLGGYSAATAAGACPDCEAPLSGYLFGIIGGTVGLCIGVLVGEESGRDLAIPIEGHAGPELEVQLRKLRQFARVASPL